jgi:hypothetical protein
MQLQPQEIQALIQFLNRVDLKGSEAETMAILKAKVRQMGEQPRPEGEGANVTDLAGAKGEGKAS